MTHETNEPPRARAAPSNAAVFAAALALAFGLGLGIVPGGAPGTAPGSAAAADGAPLDLAGAYRLAEEHDPAFRAAAARRDAALESSAIARAARRPNVRIGGSAAAESAHVDDPARRHDTYTRSSLSLDVTQPLYRPELDIRIGQAGTRERQSEASYAADRQGLMVRVASAYFGVLEAADQRRFAETNREAIAQQLRQARQRFEVGLIPVTDVEEAKSRFDLATAREIEAANGLDNAREALGEIIGEHPHRLAPLGGRIPLRVPEPADIDAWNRTALERNFRLRAAGLEAAIASDDIRRAQKADSPTLDLVGRAGASDNDSELQRSETRTGSIALQLQWPLYLGGRVPAETRAARARHREAVHEQERVRRKVARDTRQAYLGVESAIARVNALEQAVVSSKSALDAVQAGFEVGTRTSVDVLDAQSGLFQARNDLAAARYDYIVNALRLREASGTLDTPDLGAVNEWLARE